MSSCSASQASTAGVSVVSNDRREFGALGARAQLAQLEAVAQQQRQRVEEDRFSRAGLACQDGEAALELDVEGGNDDEIANREKAQHQ